MWRRLGLLAVGSLALGAGLRPLCSPRPRNALPLLSLSPAPSVATVRKRDPQGRPRWQHLWTRPSLALRQVKLAPDGNVACLYTNGRIAVLRQGDGSPAWMSVSLPLAQELVAVRGGGALAYPRRNPLAPKVWFLKGPHGIPNAFDSNGPIWTVAATLDGERAFIGTGAGSVQAVSLTTPQPSRLWQLGARPESLAVSTDGTDVIVGTWLLSGVRRLSGWAYADADPTRWHETRVSADGATTLVLSGKGPRRQNRALRLSAFDSQSGLRLWEKPVPGTDPQVALSADGQRVALSYAIETVHGVQRTWEHRLQLLGRSGVPLCEEKGGRFFDPRLVALSAVGERVTVLDSNRALLVLDSQGRTRWRLPFDETQAIDEALSTPDGTYLLLRFSDDTLSLYQATD